MATLLWPSKSQRFFWDSAEAAAVYVPWDMLVLAFSLINNLRVGSVVLSSHLPNADADSTRAFLVVRYISTHFSYVYAAMSAAGLLLAIVRRPLYRKHRLLIHGVRRCMHGCVAFAISTQPSMLRAGALRHMSLAISSKSVSTLKVLLLWNGECVSHALGACSIPCWRACGAPFLSGFVDAPLWHAYAQSHVEDSAAWDCPCCCATYSAE